MRYLLYVLGSIKNMRKPTSPPNAPRANGLSCPPHPYQLFVWITLLFVQLTYFGTIVPSLPETIAVLAYASNFTLMLLHLVTHVWCLILNPADVNVLRNWGTNRKTTSFDRTQHRHVIEDQFCHICNVYVGKHTKHCSRCNKCVADFDHHCKWLNTCIGGRNYICFLLCLASAWVGCLLIALVSTTAPTMYFVDQTWLRPFRLTNTVHKDIGPVNESNMTAPSTLNSTSSNLSPPTGIGPSFTFFAPISDVTWLTVTLLTAGLTALATALVGHLLFFHIYLVCQGLSTYQMVLRQRELEASPKMASVVPATPRLLPSCLPWSSSCQQVFNCPSKKDKPPKNQVSPAMHHNVLMTNTQSSHIGPATPVPNEGFSASPTLNRSSVPPSGNNSPRISKSSLVTDHKRQASGGQHSMETTHPVNNIPIISTTSVPAAVPHAENPAASPNTVRVNPLSTTNNPSLRASYPPLNTARSLPTKVQARSSSEKSLTSLSAYSDKWNANPTSNNCPETPKHKGTIQDRCDIEDTHGNEEAVTVPEDSHAHKQYCWQEQEPQNINSGEQEIMEDKTPPLHHSTTSPLKSNGRELKIEVSKFNSEVERTLEEEEDEDKVQKEMAQDIQTRWAYQSEVVGSDSMGPAWRWSSHHSYCPKRENRSSDMIVTRWSFPANTTQFPTPVQTHEKWTPLLKMGSNAAIFDHHQNLQEVLL